MYYYANAKNGNFEYSFFRKIMIKSFGRNSKRAFTIWELLCVLGIIVLLVALLMPALSRVRQQSTKIVCASYLSGYGKAGLLYLNDNDGVFPESSEWLYTMKSDSKAHPIGCRWHDRAMSPAGEIMKTSPEYKGKMWAYFDEMGIRPCPIFRDCVRSRNCENPDHNQDIDIKPQYSYTMNGYLGTTRDGGVLRVSEVRDPSKVFFFAEENPWSLRPDHPTFPAKWLSAPLSTMALDDTVLLITPTPQAKDCFATYHGDSNLNSGSSNVVFIDGHIESIKAEEQLRKKMHGKSRSRSSYLGSYKGRYGIGPAGNLSWAWANKSLPAGGWNEQ